MGQRRVAYGNWSEGLTAYLADHCLLKESLSPGHSVLSRQLGDADTPLQFPQGHALGSD